MTRIFTRTLAVALVLAVASSVGAQTLRIEEVDGDPRIDAWKLIVPNGSLTKAGSVGTLAFVGGTTDGAFLTGSGVPASSLGANGDAYLDVVAGSIYVKAAGSWGSAVWTDAGGTVTSVALTMPDVFSVSGSPVTTTGTLATTLATQTAGRVFAGPATGDAAAPAFRAITGTDLPDLSGTYLAVGGTAADVDPTGTDIAAALAAKRNNVNANAAITVVDDTPDTATLTWTGGKHRTLTLVADTTLSYTAPSAGDSVTMEIIGHSAAVVLTVPSTYSEATGGNRTSWTIPKDATVTVMIRYDGTAYRSYGDPVPKIKEIGSHTSPVTEAQTVTISDSIDGVMVFTNGAVEFDLEAAANWKNKVAFFYVTGTNAITIDPNASEVIVRAGTAQTGGVTLSLAGVAGNYVALYSDGVRIITMGAVGVLAAGS